MEGAKEIGLFITISVLAILLLLFFVGFLILRSKKKLQDIEIDNQVEMIKTVIEAEGKQRTQIASDLHDQILINLSLTAIHVNKRIVEIEEGGTDFNGLKKEVMGFEEIAKDIRNIAHNLLPEKFQERGLIIAIENIVHKLNGVNDSESVFINQNKLPLSLSFSKVQQLVIYQIVLELLNNLRKHAQYDYLTVTLQKINENFVLVFAHDGIGINSEDLKKVQSQKGGIGVISLESRLIFLNGSIERYDDKGVSIIKLIIPVKNEDKN